MIDQQLQELTRYCADHGIRAPEANALKNGGTLIRVPAIAVTGWNRPQVDVLFVAPPGYPAGQPDCFWVEPNNFRLANGGTPQNSNDSNPIPGDTIGRSTTWFSWHLKSWNPNRDSLITFFKVIQSRLASAQ
jgi:hypothetical protein